MPTYSEVFRIAHALRRPQTALAALEALRTHTGKAKVDGVVELLLNPPTARAAVAAIGVLAECDDPMVVDALTAALDSPHSSVRLVAVEELHRRKAEVGDSSVVQLLSRDESWVVRRAALACLADRPVLANMQVMFAVHDPHWRVRHALIQHLLRWGENESNRRVVDEHVQAMGNTPQIHGIRDYLRFRWTGELMDTRPMTDADDPTRTVPFWDWDAAVVARNMDRLGESGRRASLDVMPFLLTHAGERVRSLALDTLRRWGEPKHIAAAVALLDEPRLGTVEPVRKFTESLDLDRRGAGARFIRDSPNPSAAQRSWADDVFFEEEFYRWPASDLPSTSDEEAQPAGPVQSHPSLIKTAFETAANHPDSRVRLSLVQTLTGRSPDGAKAGCPKLQDDPHPHVRAAAMSLHRAAELVANPTQETSWHVLATAARMMKTPLWKLEPDPPWQPPPAEVVIPVPLTPRQAPLAQPRVLGPKKLAVSAMGLSGHYGLPVEGFVRAVEAGVNLFFFEPNYQTLIEFVGRLSHADRHALHFIAGTFEAEGPRVRKDVERALRLLQVEQIAVFLMFWVQSWDRIDPGVMETLDRLKDAGKIGAYSLSTHNRTLALEAIDTGWNPVMVRHSVAHRGAEAAIFPKAVATGTSIITFNNTCYGRLLEAQGDVPIPGAADCYRYTLAQPGVTVCLSAPATLEELDQNLEALLDPVLPADRLPALKAQGDRVYQEDVIFRKLVRSR
ncbi:hypothetical protein AYO44_12565 [Planctomycetaceae bacterium SCGC AG-212-F19]|nr:hypothetical protein AYO44_12565 [Planctomycetaceae bacterium SCGC AG-212-F19]